MTSPYEQLPPTAFWRTGVAESAPYELNGVYTKKWDIPRDFRIATAGSCFAQHLSRYLKNNGFTLLDAEPPPVDMPVEDHAHYGYGLYSARYGNIYTVHQLLQLAREVAGLFKPSDSVWEKNGRFYDALRPNIEPAGFASSGLVYQAREQHLGKVREMFLQMDLFVFTLGLTEAWVHRPSGTVFPTAPETIAGVFDEDQYIFKNYPFEEIRQAFNEFQQIVRTIRAGNAFKILLTVSPVPLTATASGKHVLQASTYSKSVLRAVAGQLENNQQHIDYFPSFEIITNQAARASFYDANLRTVTAEGVESVMRVFFGQHGRIAQETVSSFEADECFERLPKHGDVRCLAPEDDPQCEEVLLEAFGNKRFAVNAKKVNRKLVVFIGNSHIASVQQCADKYFSEQQDRYEFIFLPVKWLDRKWYNLNENDFLASLKVKDDYLEYIERVPSRDEMRAGAILCLVGLGMLGDGIIRAYGTLGSPGPSPEHAISPAMPVIASRQEVLEIIENNDLLKSLKCYKKYRKFYMKHFASVKDIYASLKHSDIYSHVLWMAAPNMVEYAARFRFGDDYVESLSHYLHNRIALDCFDDFLIEKNNNGWLITHPQKYEAPSGFALNHYANTDALDDIHVNHEFYKEAMQFFFDKISP